MFRVVKYKPCFELLEDRNAPVGLLHSDPLGSFMNLDVALIIRSLSNDKANSSTTMNSSPIAETISVSGAPSNNSEIFLERLFGQFLNAYPVTISSASQTTDNADLEILGQRQQSKDQAQNNLFSLRNTPTYKEGGDFFPINFTPYSGGFGNVPYSWSIDWGDGTSTQKPENYLWNPYSGTLGNWPHSYGDNGTYNAQTTFLALNMLVYGHEYIYTHYQGSPIFNVENVAPSVGAGLRSNPTTSFQQNITIDEGGTVEMSLSSGDPGWLDSVNVQVSWGDGSTNSFNYGPTSRNVPNEFYTTLSHTYTDDNPTGTNGDTYSVVVTATDDDGGSSTWTGSVHVTNIAPTIVGIPGGWQPLGQGPPSGGWHTYGDEGDEVSYSLYAVDNVHDSVSLDINWGEGDTETYSLPVVASVGDTVVPLTITHRYLDDDPTYSPQDDYTIAWVARDDDNGTTQAEWQHTVINVAPTAEMLGPPRARPNESVTISIVNVVDPGIRDEIEYRFDTNQDGLFEDEAWVSNPTYTFKLDSTLGPKSFLAEIRDDDDLDLPGILTTGLVVGLLDLDGMDALPGVDWLSETEEDDPGVLVDIPSAPTGNPDGTVDSTPGQFEDSAHLRVAAITATSQTLSWPPGLLTVTGFPDGTQFVSHGYAIIPPLESDLVLNISATQSFMENPEPAAEVTLSAEGFGQDKVTVNTAKVTGFTKIVREQLQVTDANTRWDRNGDGRISQSEMVEVMAFNGTKEVKGDNAAAVALLWGQTGLSAAEKGLDFASALNDNAIATLGVSLENLREYERLFYSGVPDQNAQLLTRWDAVKGYEKLFIKFQKKINDIPKSSNNKPVLFAKAGASPIPGAANVWSVKYSNVTAASVTQGATGDCSFLASIISQTARQNTSSILVRSIDNPSTTTDSYFVNFKAPSLTGSYEVGIKAPTESEIAAFASAGKDGIWMTVVEKAYVKARRLDTTFTYNWTMTPLTPYISYVKGEYPKDTIKVITNIVGANPPKPDPVEIRNPTPDNVNPNLKLGENNPIAVQQVRDAMNMYFVQGAVMVADTTALPQGANWNRNTDPLPEHSYAIVAWNNTTGQITIRNPHNTDDYAYGKQIELPLTDFVAKFKRLTYEVKTY